LNSRAPDRLPGGSSSGSVAAVAAGLCDFALGSDTGGSVRLPASFCGVYGLRTSHGRVDLSNAMAMSPSMDTAGWFARDATLYQRIGEVLLDGPGATHPIENLIIAEDAFAHADPEISAALHKFMESVRDRLPDIKSANILGPDMDATRECFRTLQAADVWSIYGDWVETARPPLGPGIRERIEWAAQVTPDEVAKAAGRRIEITRALNALVPPGTVVCLPSAASLPPKLTAKPEELEDFRRRTMSLICLSGLSGLPQFSIPAATVDRCPVGISFLGWAGGDEALLDLAVNLA
jgi:amidase